MRKWIGTTAGAALLLVFAATAASGQSCAGDFNFTQSVTADDVPEGVAFLFGKFGDFGTFTPTIKGVADANVDGWLTVADIGATVRRIGTPCGAATPTPTVGTPPPTSASPTPTPTGTSGVTPGTPTVTRTSTPAVTPSRTFTRPPTPTTTASSCALQSVSLGTSAGTLATTDCFVTVGRQSRYADAYSLVVATPGVAVRVEMVSTAVTPYLLVRDPGGTFVSVEGVSPIEFVSTTALPYEIYVTSRPTSVPQVGAYSLTISTRPCPAALDLGSAQLGELTTSDCPEPAAPSVGTRLNPADQFFITVTEAEVPRNIRLQMTELNSDVDPEFAVIGPDGYELLFAAEDNLIIGDSEFNEDARFLAVQPGRYTVVASGLGGLGRYRLAQVGQPQCRSKALPAFGDGTRVQVPGTLYGAISGAQSSSCAAPLRPPTSDIDVPEPNSPSDVYTFDANAGDVVSFLMESEDDPYLSLVGPTDCTRGGGGCVPNRLLATDDDGGELGGSSAQLAATIVHTGTYQIIAANTAALFPPEDGDPGEEVAYTLFTQRCPGRSPLTVNALPRTVSFDAFSCRGAGGGPVASYPFNGTAGTFVVASVTGTTFDAFVRILGPDGAVAFNDNDPFAPASADALAGRILPRTGTYFVEASASTAQAVPPLPVSYTVGVQSCPSTPGSVGTLEGSLTADDCTLPNGRHYDVYRFDGAADPLRPDVLSVAVPEGTCVGALLASGMQVPIDQCATGLFEFPLVAGRAGLIVAGTGAGAEGPYTLNLARCGATALGFGVAVTGEVSGGDCLGANGSPGEWFLVRAPAGLVTFQSNGVFGTVTGEFPLAASLTDAFGTFPAGASGLFVDDPELMYTLGPDLGLLLRVQGASAGDGGAFKVTVSAGERRQ